MSTEPIRVYYNGACPLCRAEIHHYRRIADKRGVETLSWVDITERAGTLAAFGIDDDAIIRRLHVVDGQDRLLAGVDAFIEIWERVPGYRWLGRLAAIRWIKPLAELLYDHVLAKALYHWNKRAGRVPPVQPAE